MIKIARYTAIGGAFLILLIPLLVTDSMFFPFISGKNFAFRIIVEMMLAAWAVVAIAVPAYRPRWSPLTVALAAFVAIVGIADALGENPLRSFWSNYERMEGFITILHLAAYILVAATVLRGEKIWNRFWNTSVIIATALSLYAFTELAGALPGQTVRVDATLGNATYFAVYLLFNIFLALLLAYRSRANKTLIGFYGVATAFQLVALYNTGTRGTLLGLLGGLVLAALIMAFSGARHPRLRRVSIIGIVAAVALAGAFFAARESAFVQGSPMLARIANVSLTDTTTQSRIILWTRIGRDAVAERPVLGWGQDNFIVAFGKYYDPLMYKQEPWFDRAHNVFMDWLIAGGILGLLAYLFLCGVGVYLVWRTPFTFPEKALLTGLFGAYFFHNLFVFDNLVSYIYFGSMLAYLHARSVYPEETAREQSIVPHARMTAYASVAGILLLAVVWYVNIPAIARSQTLIDALISEARKEDPAKTLAVFEKALAYRTGIGREETREQLSNSALRIVKGDAPEEVKEAFAARAVGELADSALQEPYNTRRLYFLARMLRGIGKREEARTIFEQALAINPSRQNFLYELGQTYLDEEDFDAAAEVYKRSYEVEPENDKAFTYYAATLMHAERFTEGEALLMERFGTTTIDNELLFEAYKRLGRNDKIAAILEFRISETEPYEDPGTRVSLALIYLALGRRDDAIAQIERAAELRPSFAPQAAEMIEAIRAGRNIKVTQ